MTYTPGELAVTMTQLDRPATKRRLIDWVQKGLLPPPRAHGRGRGRGKVYRWEERDILHRACDVFDLLAWKRRAADLLLPLWVLGYDVPVADVRRGLRDAVGRLDASLTAAIPFGGDHSDLISDLVVLAEAQGERQRQSDILPPPLIEAVLQAVIDPATRDWGWLLDELHQALAPTNPAEPRWPEIKGTETFIAFARDHLSVAQLEAVVADATDAEFVVGHQDLRAVAQSIRAVAGIASDLEPWVVMEVLAALGPMVAVGDLALRQAGASPLIDRWVAAIVDGCRRVLSNPALQAELRQLRAESGGPVDQQEAGRSGMPSS